jgi:pimeloyl-ACP methyl ester carboxylesterase
MKQLLLSITFFCCLTPSISAQKTITKEIEFNTKDAIKISATYIYEETSLAGIPLIILIHQGGSSRKEWMDLPLVTKLVKEGYGVLAYDIRLHGKSGKDGTFGNLYNNANRAPLDLDAAINYLFKNENVNFKRVGIVGASIGANIAAAFASKRYNEDDSSYKIKSVVVLSAKTSAAQNLSGLTKSITPKNAFYIASKEEQGGKRAFWAKELFDRTTGKRKIAIPSGKKHGSFILREHPKLQDEIVKWLQKTI